MAPLAPTWTTAVPIDEVLLLRAARLRAEDERPTRVAATPRELRRIARDLFGAADASGRDGDAPLVALALCVLCWLLVAVAVAAIV
jgi:hypothetical protein